MKEKFKELVELMESETSSDEVVAKKATELIAFVRDRNNPLPDDIFEVFKDDFKKRTVLNSFLAFLVMNMRGQV